MTLVGSLTSCQSPTYKELITDLRLSLDRTAFENCWAAITTRMTATIAAIERAMAHPRQVARPVRREEGGAGGKGGGGGGVLNSAKNA